MPILADAYESGYDVEEANDGQDAPEPAPLSPPGPASPAAPWSTGTWRGRSAPVKQEMTIYDLKVTGRSRRT